MKTIRTLNNRKFIIIIVLLTVFLMVLISCQKGSEISETDRKSDELSLEEKSSDNTEDANGLGKTENEVFPVIIKPRTPWLPYKDIPLSENTLLYEYEDIYIPFTNPSLPNATWYKYNPLTNRWYSFNPNNDDVELSQNKNSNDDADDFNGLGELYDNSDTNETKWKGTGFIPEGPPGWEEHGFNLKRPIITPEDMTLYWRI